MYKSQRLSLPILTLLLLGSTTPSFAQASAARAKVARSAEGVDTPLKARSPRPTAASAKVRAVKNVVAPVRVRSSQRIIAPIRVPAPSAPRLFAREEVIVLTSGGLLLALGTAFKRRRRDLRDPQHPSAEELVPRDRRYARELPVLWHY